jgi:hypothetical protein
MSVLFLNEKLNFTATAGILLCIIGAVIIVIHGPSSNAAKTLPEFFAYVFSPGFLVYTGVLVCVLIWLVFKVGPKYGHVHPAIYLSITALGGAYLVASAQGIEF